MSLDNKEGFRQWKEDLFQLAHTKGLTLDCAESMLVKEWNGNFTIEEVILCHVAGEHSFKNEKLVKEGSRCGCFYCLRIFSTKKIIDWCDGTIIDGYTALCPFCGIDSVLVETPDYSVDKGLLDRLHPLKFGRIEP